MAAQAALGKIGKIDFFACLPSGTYVFLCLYLGYNLDPDLGHGFQGILWEIETLVSRTTETPTTLLLIVFVSYLLGSVLRAAPVSFSESMANFWQPMKFPYKSEIKDLILIIEENFTVAQVAPQHLPSTQGEIDYFIYNYWKNMLCVGAPQAFVNYQEFEARTRYFSGMFLAGMVGVAISLLMLISSRFPSNSSYIYLLVMSSLIATAFGFNIRRTRMLEVRTLVGLYLAYIQDKKSEQG